MKTIYTKTIKALGTLMLLALMLTASFTDVLAQTWTIGTGTVTNTTTSYPCIWGNYYFGARHQYVYRASELTAAGMTAGVINQLAWQTSAANSAVEPNFTISLKNSATTALAAWETGMTVVYAPTNFTAGAAGWKTFNISAFTWDGTSNIILEVCTQGTGYTTNVPVYQTNTTIANTARWYRADASGVCTSASLTSTSTNRPNMQITRLSSCSGTPNAGVASGPSSACAAVNFTLSATGLTTGGGISYKWQNSTDGGLTWSDIPASNSSSISTSQTVATQYRVYTLCSNSGLSNVSNVVSISMAQFWACYCIGSGAPYFGASYAADEDISNVTLIGNSITLNNTTTCATAASTAPGTPSLINQYENYTNLATVPDLGQSNTYSLSLSVITCGSNYTNGFKVWIDFNQNGVFEEGAEVVYNTAIGTSGPHTETATISIPGTATLGTTGMLVKCIETSLWPYTGTSCASFGWGEGELYRVNIISTPACSGTPAAGTASATPAGLVCPNTNIALSATGLTNAPGISLKWQANNTTLGGWTNLPAGGMTVVTGSVTSAAVTITNQTENTQYRIYTLCSNSGLSNVSNVISRNMDAPTNCYCIPPDPTYGNIDDYIQRVQLNTLDVNSGVNASPYTLYAVTPANQTTTLDIGSTYSLIITNNPGWDEVYNAWIDFNINGVFDPGEAVMPQTSMSSGATQSFTFTVPATASAGLTRLRVRCLFSGTYGPCDTPSGFGETEDYRITLAALPNCTGMPVGGTATATPNPACVGIPMTLSTTGATSGVGSILYQWQRATAVGGPWTNISGANGINYNYTYAVADPNYYFRRRMVCTVTSDTAYSTSISTTKTICYCSTSFTSGNGPGYYISRVRVEGGSLDKSSLGAGAAPAYQDFTSDVSAMASVSQGSYYWLRINSGSNAGNHYYGAWADWNGDGNFTGPNENLCALQYTTNPYGPGAGGVVNILFQVPAGASLGTTRLRIRTSYADEYAFLDPCTNYVNGETEDYAIIVTSTICPPGGTIAGNFTGVTPTFTTNNDVVTGNVTGGTGTLIRWEFSWDNFATVAGSFIAYPNPAPLISLNINPYTMAYVRAVYQNEGCPSANTNKGFVKVDCASNITNGAQDNDALTNVRLRAISPSVILIDNNSLYDMVIPDGYQDFKNITANIERGKQYEIRLTPQGSWSENVAGWIDFNGDGIFQKTEMIAKSSTALTTAQTFTFTVPCSSTTPDANYVGTATMRVMCKFSSPAIDSDACSLTVYGYGEIEEYTVNILPLSHLTVSPPNAVCVPAGGTVTASGSSTGYTWAPAAGISATTGSTITLNTIPVLQFYTVTGTQAGTGCAINQTFAAATLPIGGNALPTTSVVCSGTSKIFTASGSAGNLQWQTATTPTGPWVNAPGANSNTFTLTNITGTTYVRVLVSAAACFDVSSTTAIVHASVTPTVSIINLTSTTAVITWTPFGSGQFNLAWTGAGTGNASNVTTNNYLLSGLTPNTNLNVTVSQATPNCAGTNVGTATSRTLCAKPTINTLVAVGGAPNPVGFRVTWTPVPGASAYRVYWRNLAYNGNWVFADTANGTTKTIMQANSNIVAPGADIAVYVAVNNCPGNAVLLGDGSTISYVSLPPAAGCTAVPTFTATSNCPNQISVTGLSGSSSGTYEVWFRRVYPTYTSAIAYTTSASSMNLSINAAYSGTVWEVSARSKCGSVMGNMSAITYVNVKPGCLTINNPVLSKINCNGCTITWNSDDCNGLGISGYYLNIKKSAAPAFSAYPTGGSNTYKVVNWLTPNTSYDINVQSVSCNGSLSATSQTLTFTTSGPGCREDEAEMVQPVNGNGEMVNIFPNPNNGNFSVSINSEVLGEQEVRLDVMNALGQVLVTNVATMTGGHTIEGIQLDNTVAAGVYFVRVQVGNNVYVNRLVVNRD